MSLNRDIQVVFEDLENEMEDARKNFFEDDGFFSENSILKSTQSLLNKDVSLFNSNNRGKEENSFDAFPSSMRSRLEGGDAFGQLIAPEFAEMPVRRMSAQLAKDEFSWTDETHWQKTITLNAEMSYSNVNINVKDNMLVIGAAEESIAESSGRKSMSSASFTKCFSLPPHTKKESVKAEIQGSTITVKGEVNKVEAIDNTVTHEIPIKFE